VTLDEYTDAHPPEAAAPRHMTPGRDTDDHLTRDNHCHPAARHHRRSQPLGTQVVLVHTNDPDTNQIIA
jgi:hypothetical protein